jgi:phosphate acetyltransferase
MTHTLENKTIDEIAIGETVSCERTVSLADLRARAVALGDVEVGTADRAGESAAGIVTTLLSSMVELRLPGFGSVIRCVSVRLHDDVPIGVPITASLVVRQTRPDLGVVLLDGRCTDASGALVADATFEVLAPQAKVRRELPEHRLDDLLERCGGLRPMLTGVVHPCSADALLGAVQAGADGLIEPVLFGPTEELQRVAEQARIDLSRYRVVATLDAEDSAAKAAAAAGAGEVQALMKGSLHSDVLLHSVVRREAKLHAGRLLSHCALVSVPTYARRVVISDAALNIAPDTDQKRDICQNAIGFARALGIPVPKVAVLAAVETVRTKMPATLDGAILAKMADRRQIVGGIVDGPLDLDAAVDAGAAKVKHIESPVAGAADVLIAPNIEAGNMVYKDLAFMANSQAAGLVVGAKVPVILTSRADSAATRRFSAAAAVLYAQALAADPTIAFPEVAE